MSRRELISIWILGCFLCAELIALCKLVQADLYAFFSSSIVFTSLSTIKDGQRQNIFDVIRQALRS